MFARPTALFARLAARHAFRFSLQQNPEKPGDEKEKGEEFSEVEKDLLKTYKVDPVWNMILDLEKSHNFQRELIAHRHDYEKSTYELRSAILFEDLLKSELTIVIYDTFGRPFRWQLLKFVYMLLTVGLALWGIDLLVQADPRNKVLLEKTFYGKIYRWTIYLLCVVLFFRAWGRHMSFKKRFVDKIVYDTQKEEFTLTKRNFWGVKKDYLVSRYKLLYTENPFLTSKGTNYFNIDTKDEFMIVYKDAWLKQDLFSHLISQRIKL
jgi:hypothetical protein